MPILQYSNWQNFEKIIQKAKIACKNSGIAVIDHFTDVTKMVQIGSGAYREQIDYKLTRYACYLIAQNGDSRKKVIALAQTYFAVQTRKQEISEKEYSLLTEDEKRFYQRNKIKKILFFGSIFFIFYKQKLIILFFTRKQLPMILMECNVKINM